jgi:hypothetical protein
LGRHVAAHRLFAVLRNCLPGASPERLATLVVLSSLPVAIAFWQSMREIGCAFPRLYFRSDSTQVWQGTVNVGYWHILHVSFNGPTVGNAVDSGHRSKTG